jgi:tetratricopeptide (TPR) repeat protein
MFKTDIETTEILEEIGDELAKINKYETAEVCYSKIIGLAKAKPWKPVTNIGEVYAKLGKIYHSQNQLDRAREAFESSMNYLEGENEKAKIRSLMENLRENEDYFDNEINY